MLDYTAGEFYLNIQPKFSGFDDTRGDKRHLKKQNKHTFYNYFATFVLELYENIRGSEPKIAEKSRLVRIKGGQNWHIPALSIIIGVITLWFITQWLQLLEMGLCAKGLSCWPLKLTGRTSFQKAKKPCHLTLGASKFPPVDSSISIF